MIKPDKEKFLCIKYSHICIFAWIQINIHVLPWQPTPLRKILILWLSWLPVDIEHWSWCHCPCFQGQGFHFWSKNSNIWCVLRCFILITCILLYISAGGSFFFEHVERFFVLWKNRMTETSISMWCWRITRRYFRRQDEVMVFGREANLPIDLMYPTTSVKKTTPLWTHWRRFLA